MEQDSDPTFLVLHALRVRGFAVTSAVAETSTLEQAAAQAILERLEHDGYVMLREGRVSGWRTTPAGNDVHASMLAREMCNASIVQRLASAYATFEPRNEQFKQVCFEWQMRDGAINDHTDRDYDRALIWRLGDIHQRTLQTIDDLSATTPRFCHYGPRLGDALGRLDGGDNDAFTKPLHGSYHDIWMELHQDLILTLGRIRTAADA